MSKRLYTIIIIVLLLLLIYILFIVDPINNDPIYRYEDIKPMLKTGDIILFTCKTHGSFMDKLMYASRTNLLGTDYGHAGIVMKGKNNMYIAECCGSDQCGFTYAKYLNKCGKGGIRIIEMDRLLKDYYDEYKGIYAVKFISKEIPNSVLMDSVKKYKDIIFQERKTLFKLAITDIFVSHNLAKNLADGCPTDQMICTEFLYKVLHDCGVLKEYPAKLFWPHLISGDTFEKLENIKYSRDHKFTIVDNISNSYNQKY